MQDYTRIPARSTPISPVGAPPPPASVSTTPAAPVTPPAGSPPPRATPSPGLPPEQVQTDVVQAVNAGGHQLETAETLARYQQLEQAIPQLGQPPSETNTTDDAPAINDHARQHYQAGNQAFEQGNFLQAGREYLQARENLSPADRNTRASLSYNIATALERQARTAPPAERERLTTEATEAYRDFLQNAPADADPQAIDHAQQQIAASAPTTSEASQQALREGEQAFTQGDFVTAEQHFRQSLETLPPGSPATTTAPLHYNLARALQEQGRNAEAAQEYGRYLNLAPPQAPEGALASAREFIQQQGQGQVAGPANSREHLAQGTTAFNNGQYALASSHFQQALDQTSPTAPQTYAPLCYNLATAQERDGHLAAAAQSYARYLETAPAGADPAAIAHAQEVIRQQQLIGY
jgi:tetratricopeptide (TPR) repeat protein